MTKRVNKRKGFWEKEYKKGEHLSLSDKPSEDLEKFTRWYKREYGKPILSHDTSVLDLGCGNGRNLTYLAKEFGASGVGFDNAHEAIEQAKEKSEGFTIQYIERSISPPIPLPDESQTLVLDMMASFLLKESERSLLYKEIARVLKSDGWLFLKTFLLDEDRNALRLLREHPAKEKNSYIHPKIGVAEHVFTEDEIRTALAPCFTIHKIMKSHRHKGPRAKRRSMSIYAQKGLISPQTFSEVNIDFI